MAARVDLRLAVIANLSAYSNARTSKADDQVRAGTMLYPIQE